MKEAVKIESSHASARENELVELRGHVAARKNLGKLVFLTLRDRGGTTQLVAEGELAEACGHINLESAVVATGKLRKINGSEIPELALENVQVVGASKGAPPVELNKRKAMEALSPQSLHDLRPLTLRSPSVRAIFQLQSEILYAWRSELRELGFTEIHSPKLVASGTEGGANLFTLDYFGKRACLAQSPQFYKQMMVGVFERVFEVGPVYRAEEHDTTRHLNEYVSLDFEMGFITGMSDLIAIQERLLESVFAHLEKSSGAIFESYGMSVPRLSGPIPRLTLAEARRILLERHGWKSREVDLDAEGERLICAHIRETTGSRLLYLTHYPRRVRPFYAMPAEELEGEVTTESFDLLFDGLEITTGGQRIHLLPDLVQSISERGLNPEEFSDYLLAFEYGLPPHGGLAVGLERLCKQLLGLASVKQAALFPRDKNRITP